MCACAGLQYVLPATWTAVKRLDPNAPDDSTLMQLSRWWSSNPSQIAGVGSRKGQIAKGFDADFVVRDFCHLFCCSSCHSVFAFAASLVCSPQDTASATCALALRLVPTLALPFWRHSVRCMLDSVTWSRHIDVPCTHIDAVRPQRQCALCCTLT